ncbi:hypothetical protein ACLSYG_15830 [Enterococcus gallinarum]|uniref:hypothetical protein n=1 Tax=Enterococcus TaxID=1350 RepID=UPI003BF8A8DF
MLYKDNQYTEMLSSLLSKVAVSSETTFRPMFLVDGNLILGTVISPDDDRLNETELSKDSSIFLTSAANIVAIRGKYFDSNIPENELTSYEPVYLYLEDVIIYSTSGNKTIHIPEFALRISSIDGISLGDIEKFKSE